MRPELVLSHEERKRRFVNERVKEEFEKIKNVRNKTKNNNKSEDLREDVDVDDINENIDVIEITQEEEWPEFYIYNLYSYKHKKFRIRSHEFNSVQ